MRLRRSAGFVCCLTVVLAVTAAAAGIVGYFRNGAVSFAPPPPSLPEPAYLPRRAFDTGGFSVALAQLKPWRPDASLEEIADSWRTVATHGAPAPDGPPKAQVDALFKEAQLANFEGKPAQAYEVLGRLRDLLEADSPWPGRTCTPSSTTRA